MAKDEEYPRSVRILLEDIAEWEKERDELNRKITRAREYIREAMTGKPSPSPSSTASRIIVGIKERLAQGPATLEQVLEYLIDKQKTGRVIIKGDPEATTKRSLGKSVNAGTIIQEGEFYRLP